MRLPITMMNAMITAFPCHSWGIRYPASLMLSTILVAVVVIAAIAMPAMRHEPM